MITVYSIYYTKEMHAINLFQLNYSNKTLY